MGDSCTGQAKEQSAPNSKRKVLLGYQVRITTHTVKVENLVHIWAQMLQPAQKPMNIFAKALWRGWQVAINPRM